jgi:aspartyl-tRNA(Asn)/glutamyl-tRNA(Gln) amidotransferase subunit A
MAAASSLTASSVAAQLRNKVLSSAELTREILKRLEMIEPIVRSCVSIDAEGALKQAEAADKAIGRGEGSPLTGVPILLKDNICTRGLRTTCSSRILENFIPRYDALVTNRLRELGAVIIGKTNMDEFAMGSSTENSAFFPTRNPWDTSRVPGGSSGGSAAAISADEAFLALGSDTGGSIRQPAGFCSVVGLKPTYGRVSRFGLVAFASSLDQIGPLTKDVTDCAMIMNIIAGHDARDSTSVPIKVPDYTRALVPDIKGMKIGVPSEYFGTGMQPDIVPVIDSALGALKTLGAVLVPLSLPHTPYALSVYYIIAPSEASSNLARYDGVKYGFSSPEEASIWDATARTRQIGFGAEVKRRIMLGTYALSAGYYDAYYLKAQKVRTLIRRDFDEVFKQVQAVVTPTSPGVPFPLGQKVDDPIQMYLSDVCTLSANIAGIPGISVPAGFANNLPVGIQFMAPAFGEETLIRIAYAFEQATDAHLKKPPLPVT